MSVSIDSTFSRTVGVQLSTTSRAISRALSRLSTGKRVNGAQDGSADFAQITRLDSQIRGTTEGLRNINRAKGLLDVANSGIQNQLEILQRMREIAVSGANGSLGEQDRDNLNNELQSLLSEFHRISEETKFDNLPLLGGDVEDMALQVGPNAKDTLTLSLESFEANDLFTKTVGTGKFQASQTVSSVNTYSIAKGDFNGDGKIDLVQGGLSVGILLGKGDGTFQTIRTLASGGAGQIRVEDFNRDGIDDFAATDTGSASVSIYLGNGDGSFKPRVTLFRPGTGGVRQLGVGDFNSDGRIDLFSGGTNNTLYLGNGDGTFQSALTVSTGVGSSTIEVGDLNGDGIDDVVADTRVLISNGDGTFRQSATVPLDIVRSRIGDLNGDHVLDIVQADAFGFLVSYLGNGDGTFQTGITSFDQGIFTNLFLDTELLDLNGDEILDVAAVEYNSNQLLLFLGNGNGTFRAPLCQAATMGDTIASADVNGDGVEDLVTGASSLVVFVSRTSDVTALTSINISTEESSTKLTKILDRAIDQVVEGQADLSALYSRLDVVAAQNLLMFDTLSDAKSSLEDADFAVETAELVRQQILQQAQVATLAQAHVSMQVVLRLLQSL